VCFVLRERYRALAQFFTCRPTGDIIISMRVR